MGLAVNKGKTKYILSTCRDVPRMGSQIMTNSYIFDIVNEFLYLGTAINTKNDDQPENQAQNNSSQQVLFWSQ